MNKTEGNKKLKSCPICNNRARIYKAPNGYYGVTCDKIGCIIMQASYERSIEKLVKDWNTRYEKSIVF